MLVLEDCGRRMRADDRRQRVGTSHFDQALNAVMLLACVALKQGDAIGVMTFGTPAGEERSLVIVITNFRDQDSTELGLALRLLRSRHLVLVASLRERIVGDLISQPLSSGDAVLDVASGHFYEQARRDAFNRLAAHDSMMVDAEPADLAWRSSTGYHAIKRAGLI